MLPLTSYDYCMEKIFKKYIFSLTYLKLLDEQGCLVLLVLPSLCLELFQLFHLDLRQTQPNVYRESQSELSPLTCGKLSLTYTEKIKVNFPP